MLTPTLDPSGPSELTEDLVHMEEEVSDSAGAGPQRASTPKKTEAEGAKPSRGRPHRVGAGTGRVEGAQGGCG